MFRTNTPLRGLGLLLLAAMVFACSGNDDEESDNGGSAASSGSAGAASSAGTGAASGTGGGASDGSSGGGFINPEAGPSTGGTDGGEIDGSPSEEVCDGVDNDLNGIIDDVDVAGDGVCDCLNIATIGAIGPWSNGGNIFRDWLNTRSSTPAVELGDQELTDEVLEPFQVIVVLYASTMELTGGTQTLSAHHEFSTAEVEAMSRWVENNGGLMTTIGYTADEASEVENVNRLLGPFGLGYSTTNLSLTGFITDWSTHPVTDSVLNIFTDNGVEPTSGGITLAQDSDGRIALKVDEIGSGKVAVWGDEWITYDSEWEDVEEQQVERLWLNMLKWLTPEVECQVPLPPPK